MLKYAVGKCFTTGELYMDNHKWEYIDDITDNSLNYSEFMIEGTCLDDEYEDIRTDVVHSDYYQEPINEIEN